MVLSLFLWNFGVS